MNIKSNYLYNLIKKGGVKPPLLKVEEESIDTQVGRLLQGLDGSDFIIKLKVYPEEDLYQMLAESGLHKELYEYSIKLNPRTGQHKSHERATESRCGSVNFTKQAVKAPHTSRLDHGALLYSQPNRAYLDTIYNLWREKNSNPKKHCVLTCVQML